MKTRQQLLSQELSEKTSSETRFRDQCDHLDRQISELMSVMERREFEFIEVVKKLESLEEDCTEGRVEVIQLKADLKNAEDQKNFMSEKVKGIIAC